MELVSPAFNNNGDIPKKYTCQGIDVNPSLVVTNVPEKAESLVLIMDDPDAVKPAGKVWDHWIIFNIPTTIAEIHEAEEPKGTQGMTSFGKLGYGGPCPPDTKHRYYFKLYALDIKLDLPEGSEKSEVEEAMKEHILDKAELVGLYEKD